MKFNQEIHLFLMRELTARAQQIGITDELKLVYTRRQVLDMPPELTEGRRTTATKYMGVCFIRAKTIFINVKAFKSRARMRRTLIHELVHYRFRYLKHGRKFDERIDKILKGVFYPAKTQD